MKKTVLALDISRQPNDSTCGPTSLHAVYQYYGENITLDEVIAQVPYLKSGGTLAVMLGIHALKNGYDATIFTYNLKVFDPTWFTQHVDLIEKLNKQLHYKKGVKFREASKAYIQFLELGGKIMYKPLNHSLIEDLLLNGIPILTGLSATYLYNEARELSDPVRFDDVKGEPSGHFVVVNGFDKEKQHVFISDPLKENPFEKQQYAVKTDHLICSILLGIMTYDANLLVITPK